MTWLPLKPLFDLLSPENVLGIVSCLLTEQRVILHSRSLRKLTMVSQVRSVVESP